MKIEDIDVNFKVKGQIPEGTEFYRPGESPLALYGVFMENGKYRRMPEKTAAAVSKEVYALHANTAGGRLRFRTDSPWISVCAELDQVCRMSHFALTGSAGFDLYRRENGKFRYVGTFIPEYDMISRLQATVYTDTEGMQDYLIHFPLYTDVKSVLIGFKEGSGTADAEPYCPAAPFVTYGSSITQGGCASRPGNSYQNILSRRLNADHINLGFSGSALGEDPMMAYIAGLSMSAFILDYDFNAPTGEHLWKTHEKAYRTVRNQNPDLPILLLSRPRFYLNDEDRERLAIIRATYEKAKAEGDRNLYFITGTELMQYCGQEGTVDGTHPTDFGFYSMAKVIGDFLEKLGLYTSR